MLVLLYKSPSVALKRESYERFKILEGKDVLRTIPIANAADEKGRVNVNICNLSQKPSY